MLRYRADACPPPGPRICALCGNRSCNVRCANTLRRAAIGWLTVQYNPAAKGAVSLGQWLTAVMSMKGESDQMTVPAAVEMIRATRPEKRSEFAEAIWRRRANAMALPAEPAALRSEENSSMRKRRVLAVPPRLEAADLSDRAFTRSIQLLREIRAEDPDLPFRRVHQGIEGGKHAAGYQSDWRGFCAWCERQNPCPLPAAAEAVATYIAEYAA